VWDKVQHYYERQRFLGLLFMLAVAGLFLYVLFASKFRVTNVILGHLVLMVFLINVIRRVRLVRRRQKIRAPVGPLSTDERLKARAKLVRLGR
jgi:hypothetical protein